MIFSLFHNTLAVANTGIYDADCSAQPPVSLQLILCLSLAGVLLDILSSA